jgi:hypothetical protein
LACSNPPRPNNSSRRDVGDGDIRKVACEHAAYDGASEPGHQGDDSRRFDPASLRAVVCIWPRQLRRSHGHCHVVELRDVQWKRKLLRTQRGSINHSLITREKACYLWCHQAAKHSRVCRLVAMRPWSGSFKSPFYLMVQDIVFSLFYSPSLNTHCSINSSSVIFNCACTIVRISSESINCLPRPAKHLLTPCARTDFIISSLLTVH